METARQLKQTDGNFYFVVPTVKTVAKRVKEMVRGSGLEILVAESEEDRHNAFVASEAAIAASGTVALELAIADIPHIVAYKVSPFSALLVRYFLHIQFVNLSNILLGREIIPELLQERCISGNILSYMKTYWNTATGMTSRKKVLEKSAPFWAWANRRRAKMLPT